jgi:RNA polymerase sigma factor (sigma-70 family)
LIDSGARKSPLCSSSLGQNAKSAGPRRPWQALSTAMHDPDSPDLGQQPPSPEVVRALVDNHRNFLVFLEKRVGSRALAEDILQEAFARGLDRIGHLQSEESAKAWFYRLLRNAVIDTYRRRAAAARGIEAFAADLDQQQEPSPDMHAVVCQCIAGLAATLKPEYAAALQRIEIDGVAVKDFAAEAGISSSNAGVRVFRAREALRQQVARSCGTCADHGCLDCSCKKNGDHGHGSA